MVAVKRKLGFLWLELLAAILMTSEASSSAEGTAQILSFTFETKNPTTEQWVVTTDIQKGDHIRLMCTLDDALIADEFTIRKLRETNSLEPLEHRTNRQIVYEILNLGCSNSGSYVCEGGNGVSRSLDLSIFDCSPQILSFTFENWDPVESRWTTSTDIERGKKVRLVCTIGGSTSDNFKLKKLNALNALEPLEYPHHRQIIHEFKNLECHQAGTYVCGDENSLSRILEIEVSGCSSEILSFTFEEWDPLHERWRTTTDIEEGKDIRLTCTISGPFSKKFSIKKLDETYIPVSLDYPNSRQVSHTIRGVGCDKFGTYVCENGLGASRMTELGIFKCAPRFCDIKQETTGTTQMRLGDFISFKLCVVAFPDIDVAISTSTEAKAPTENQVSASHFETSSEEDEKAASNVWDIYIELKPDTFGEYMIKISKTLSSEDDYGEHTLIISTTHKGSRKELNYTYVVTQPSDSDDCPTDLTVTELEAKSLQLSWKPRVQMVDAQYFVIFLSEDEKGWVSYGNETQETLHITGLQDDTQYAFRVVPVNQDYPEPDGNQCHNTIRVKTAKGSDAGTHNSSSIIITLSVLAFVAAAIGLILLAVILTKCCIMPHLRCRHTNTNKRNAALECGPSREGLMASNTNGVV